MVGRIDYMKIIKNKGFTLLELLVVVSIIALLTAIAVVSFGKAQQSARDSRRRADIKAIQVAMEQYYNTNYTYPATIAGLDTSYLPGGLPFDPRATTINYSAVYVNTAGYTYCGDLENDGTFQTYAVENEEEDYCVSNLQR